MNNSKENKQSRHKAIEDDIKARVRFAHLRSTEVPVARDGATQSPGATIGFYDQGDEYYAAVAYCNPLDNFCKATGRTKATGRLVQIVAATKWGNNVLEGRDSHYYGQKDTAGVTSFNEFKSRVIAAVAEGGNYNVLPGSKQEK